MKLTLLAASLLVSALAHADDAAISFGGSPKMLKGHPTIRMAREKIVIRILPRTMKFDCTFVFKNEGAACKVKMGFPDRGSDAFAEDYDIESAKATDSHEPYPPFQELKQFHAYVDGKACRTSLLKDGDHARSWHAKVVSFGKNQTRVVRDTYEIPFSSGSVPGSNSYIRECHYILSTGASWKGPIGLIDLEVIFDRRCVPAPVRPLPVRQLKVKNAWEYEHWKQLSKSTVVYSALTDPTAKGKTLRFVKKNVKPVDADDIRLHFEEMTYEKLENTMGKD